MVLTKIELLGLIPVRVTSLDSLRLSVRSINGKRILGVNQYGLQLPFGEDYNSSPSIPSEWVDSVGDHQLEKNETLPPFEKLGLTVEDGVLILKANARKIGKLSTVIGPTSDTEAVILGF